MTRILGISAYYHDSAACLVEDGRIVAAAQEERFTRKKHDAGFPDACRRRTACTKRASRAAELDLVGFYEKPLVKFERLLETYTSLRAPRATLVPDGHAALAWPRSCGWPTTSASGSRATRAR